LKPNVCAVAKLVKKLTQAFTIRGLALFIEIFANKPQKFAVYFTNEVHFCEELNENFKKIVNCAVFSKKHLIFQESKVE
jgi:hypothetical protein